MERQPINSTSLRAIGYDAGRQVLEVEFRGGGVYRYTGVPPDVYVGLRDAASPGNYFVSYVRDLFPHQRVTSAPASPESPDAGAPPPV